MIPDSQVEAWLEEDLGHHDVTNDVPGRTEGRLVATEPGVVAGTAAAAAVFAYLDCDVEVWLGDGERVEPATTVLSVEGPARDVLRGERVAVNVAGHASGVATRTREAVEAARRAVEAAGGDVETADGGADDADGGAEASGGDDESADEVRVAATRKTTPGLRGVEKRAVAAGGGDTHRLDLSHMVMVKDNHVAEVGLERAVERFRERTSFATKIEVEVDDPEDAPRAAEAGADVVLLDNMDTTTTRRAVESLREATADGGRAVLVEASGGITVDDVPGYARTGVDVISMGSLTHSAPSLDYSFRTG